MQTSGMTTPTELAADIRLAFDHVRYPGDARLTSDSSAESLQLVAPLRGKNWHHLTLEDLTRTRTLDETLGALSPLAFHYYLPALLLMALAEPPDESFIATVITSHLTASDRATPTSIRENEQTLKLLTTPQRLAVRHFFEWLKLSPVTCPAIIDSALDNLAHDRIRPYPSKQVEAWCQGYQENFKP